MIILSKIIYPGHIHQFDVLVENDIEESKEKVSPDPGEFPDSGEGSEESMISSENSEESSGEDETEADEPPPTNSGKEVCSRKCLIHLKRNPERCPQLSLKSRVRCYLILLN